MTEGFKGEQKPQIEVNRPPAECLGQKHNIIALVSEDVVYEDIPNFGLEDAQGVADLLENLINSEGGR